VRFFSAACKKNGDLDQYYKDVSELAQEFPIEVIDELELAACI
jgi:hypothetical protein